MAPELLRGRPADARSDLYAFSVALYEALYGRRPFDGDSLAALFTAVLSAEIQEPRGVRVPAWLRRAVLRGLARDPADRPAGMDELLAALTEIPARRRRLALGAAGVLGAGLLAMSLTTFSKRPVCEGMDAHLDGVWDPPRRAALAARFADPRRPYAAAAWAGVARRLDEYGAAWVAMRRDACEATQVRGDASSDLMDRRMACLDQRLVALRRLVDVIEESDPSIIDAAPSFVGALRPLDRCADADALLADLPPPDDPDVARAVADARDQLARVEAFIRVGRLVDAADLAARTADAARAVDYPPILAEALIARGHARRLDWGEGAAVALEEGYALAEAAGHARARLRAAIDMVTLHAAARRFDAADAWAVVAGALAARVDEPDLAAELARGLGVLAYHRGDLARAEDHFRRALAIYRDLGPGHDAEAAALLSNLGGVLAARMRLDEADAALRESMSVIEAGFGPEHPLLANTLQNLGATLDTRQRYRESTELLARRELPLRVAALGADHPIVRERTCGLGRAWARLGEADAALDAYDRCLALTPREPAPHIELRAHLARCGLLVGRDESARKDSCDRALALVDAAAASERWRDPLEVTAVVETLQHAAVPADTPVVEPLLAHALAAADDLGAVYLSATVHLAVARHRIAVGPAAEAARALTAARERIAEISEPDERAFLEAEADRIQRALAAP